MAHGEKSTTGGVPEIPPTMIAQAAAAAAGNAEDETHDGRITESDIASLNSRYEDDTPPPEYSEDFGNIVDENQSLGVDTKASITQDGRVDININQTSARLTALLAPALRHQIEIQDQEPPPPAYIPPSLGGEPGKAPPPPLNVVIHVVGSRGDVQPFVALGKVLKDTYGHRVRLATHPTFRDFVTENGLEFFNIGGDPAELMAFMVKNPGLMPGFDTLRSGDVGKRRKEIAEMVKGCWRSCIEAGDGTGVEVSDNTVEDWMSSGTSNPGRSRVVDPNDTPFVADAIIANPPSFAHIHCAEKLGCPLHVMFTMPYSPTQAFPHPLANIQSSNADASLTNYMSYTLVEMMTWQGLGDVMNRFRQKSLGLEPMTPVSAPGMLSRLKIPYTYCWSPALIPKPKDWASHISISGFYFLSLASNYTPAPDLKAFLDAGPPPVYIGFGSIVVDDPTAMTKMIFDAVQQTGQRALVSKGWGGIGADQLGIPDSVFMLGNVPHDWLFKHVSCVVHHGGAGTTAAGIACGKPTVVVPFFGDQPFWGAMVAKAGAGPQPIAYKDLDADKLARSIETALTPESLDRAKALAASISHEDGCQLGAQSFHQFLELDRLRCSIAPSRAAVWRLKRTKVRFSAFAATVLANEGLLDFRDLKLYRHQEYDTDNGPSDPITGATGALVGTASSMMMGFADLPVAALKALHIHPDASKKAKRKDSESSKATSTSEGKEVSEARISRTETEDSSRSSASTSPTASRAPSQFNVSESLAKVRSPSTTDNQASAGNAKNPLSGMTASEHFETAMGTGQGISRMVSAGFKSPMDFTNSLAKGFHNAPKLYGDDTVRKHDHITDFRSGLRAATKGFGFGLYDGITGLVTQPMAGAKKEGAAGFVKGFGKGIGGIVLKPSAGAMAIPGYTMKGIYREMQAKLGSSVQNYIIAARTAQGYADWHDSHPEERADVISRWTVLKENLKKKKNVDEILHDWAVKREAQRQAGQEQAKAMFKDGVSTGRRKSMEMVGQIRRASDRARSRSGSRTRVSRGTDNAQSSETAIEAEEPVRQANVSTGVPDDEEAEFERAIQTSVAETSRGNPEQDAAIERAIRASINELRSGGGGGGHSDDEDRQALEKAMAASMAESHPEPSADEDLEKAIQDSIAAHRAQTQGRQGNTDFDDDEELNKVLRESTHPALRAAGQGELDAADEEELKRALKESSELSAQEQQKQKSEEEVVLEYVKKQSLIEEQHRAALAGKGKGKEVDEEVEGGGESDEELQRAIKLSMQREGQSGQSSA